MVTRGGLALPMVVMGIVFGYSIYTLAAMEKPDPEKPAVKINVIARRWWWEVMYPEQGFNTANEIHMPVGVPVQIELESADVIHSFWVPELHGKMDLIPTRINTMTLQADQPGVYRGECAEFCGLQHAHMGLYGGRGKQDDYRQVDLRPTAARRATPANAAGAAGPAGFLNGGLRFLPYHPRDG